MCIYSVRTVACCCTSSYTCHPRCFLYSSSTCRQPLLLVVRTNVLYCWSTPLRRTVAFVRPRLHLFLYHTSLRQYGHARSRRRASARRGEAPLVTMYNILYHPLSCLLYPTGNFILDPVSCTVTLILHLLSCVSCILHAVHVAYPGYPALYSESYTRYPVFKSCTTAVQ